MSGAILNTKNGQKVLDDDVANYIVRLQNQIDELTKENIDLKLKVFSYKEMIEHKLESRSIFSFFR